jgi:PAS domain S-box-containing protein
MPRWIPQLRVAVLTASFLAAAILATAVIPFTGAPSYLLLLMAILAAAWYCGRWAALVATALVVPFSHLFFRVGEDSTVRLILLTTASVTMIFWVHREQRLRSAIEESERRFRLLMENVSSYAIILADPDGNIIDWSSGAEEIIGLDGSDRGKSLRLLFPPEEGEGLYEEFSSAEQSGRAVDERWHVRKDGSKFWGYGMLTALYDPNGTLNGYVTILRDLTERRTAEQERARLMQEIENTNSILEQMVAALAHDIRAHLNAILGWVSLKKAGALADAAKLDRAFDSIERNAREQLDLMEGLLELSRVKSGKTEAEFDTCDIRAVIRDALETVWPATRLKQIRVEQRFECSQPFITANRNWLVQIFTNILSNAVKFTPAGGRICLACRELSNTLRVEVIDSGPGIPREQIDEIFEPFKRGAARAPGVGLGLAIVRELVERHGGRVFAQSEGHGKGATFIVELPRTPRDHHQLAS